jgi:hypothetical protein
VCHRWLGRFGGVHIEVAGAGEVMRLQCKEPRNSVAIHGLNNRRFNNGERKGCFSHSTRAKDADLRSLSLQRRCAISSTKSVLP